MGLCREMPNRTQNVSVRNPSDILGKPLDHSGGCGGLTVVAGLCDCVVVGRAERFLEGSRCWSLAA